MVDLSKKEEPAPKKPEALPPKPSPPSQPPQPSKPAKKPSLSFGELELGGASADSPELELAAAGEEPAAPKPPPAPPVEPRPAEREPPPMREPSKEYVPYVPKRSYGRQIKIILIIVLALAAIGGGIYGFLKWRESVEAAEAAEKAKIESSSRDSLMDDTFKKEKFK